MNNRIFVPIALKALLVGLYPEYLWRAVAEDDFTTLADDVTGRLVRGALSRTREMPKGAHLLWSLPDALTAGAQNDGTDEATFPPVPTRWLVTRVWTGAAAAAGTLRTKSWIVESDALNRTTSPENRNIGSAACAFLPAESETTEQPYRFLGRSFPAADKPPPPEGRLHGMTAAGSGDPARFAFYATSRNVFAFHDDLTDGSGKRMENISVCYSVTGIYPDAALDPLGKIPTAEACLAQFNWRAPDGAKFPASCVCHGALTGIEWKRDDTDYSEGIPGSLPVPKIAVGNTSAEALAAVAEAESNGGRDAARTLQHLISGTRHLLGGVDGILDAEKQMHADRFGVRNASAARALKPKAENSPVPAPFEETLIRAINETTRTLDLLERELSDKQRALHENWIRLKQLDREKPSKKIVGLKASCRAAIREALQASPGSIRDLLSDRALRRAELDADTRALEKAPPRNHEVAEQGGQRFFHPRNPVLLLSGVPRDFSHGADGRHADDGSLKVRAGVLAGITVPASPGILPAEQTLPAGSLPEAGASGTAEERSLIAEAALLNPGFARVIAGNILIRAGKKAEGDALAKLAETVRLIQSAASPGLEGDAPSPVAVERYAHPWIPLSVDWQAAYYPDPALIAATPDLKNWRRRGLDAVFTDAAVPAKKKITLGSRHLITPHAPQIAADAAARACGSSLGLDKLAVLSQEMSGVQEALLQETADISMPVFDTPYGDPDLAAPAAPLLRDTAFPQPLFDTLFSPVRGGFLELNRVTVIDAFGQFIEQNPGGCLVGEDLRHGETPFQPYIMLPPRILQAARIRFDWTRPDTPVAGLIVPNRLDASLAVFGADGVLLGSLQRVGDGSNPVVWKVPPDKGGGTTPLPEAMDSDLRAFLATLLAASKQRGADLLRPLLDSIDTLFWQINPSTADMDPMSMYFGRPLAIARGSVRLETAEPPRRFRSLGVKAPAGPDVDVEHAEFPVRIGRRELHRDGVVGFFADGDYARLHLPLDETPADGYFTNEVEITLRPNAPAPRSLTFLFDPAGEINLDSGFLPVKTIVPDRAAIAAALSKLHHAVQAFPLLTRGEKPVFPRPDVEGKHWSWLEVGEDGATTETPDTARADADAYFSGDGNGDTGATAREGWLLLRPAREPAGETQ